MKYSEDYINKIICGDCLEVMKNIPEDSIDLIVTDPPYGIKYANWDNKIIDISKESYRVLKLNGSIVIFSGWSNVLDVKLQMEKYFRLNNWIIYDRIKGRGAKYNLVSTREDILWFVKGTKWTFNKQQSNVPKKTKGMGSKNGLKNRVLSNVWSDIPPLVPWSKERVNHPTQKPCSLIDRIIKMCSNEEDLVLDPFLGSGTTAVSCKKLNRNFIGIDIAREYCKLANERIFKPIC